MNQPHKRPAAAYAAGEYGHCADYRRDVEPSQERKAHPVLLVQVLESSLPLVVKPLPAVHRKDVGELLMKFW